MVWVRFPGLGLEFWDEKILFTICKEIGTPLKIDNATARCEDVMIPYCPKYCSSCKIVGHLNSECKFKKNTVQEKPVETVESVPKNDQRREPQVSFDICNPILSEDSVVDSIKDVVQTSSSNVESISQGNKSSALENVPQEEVLEEVIMETPKIVKVVEANTLNNSTFKFINGTNGKVEEVPIQVTSWYKVVEKKMVTSTSTSTSASVKVHKSPNASSKVSGQIPQNNKYNFRKQPGKGGTKDPHLKQ
ncbi:uncharacterized protein LOC113279140 [Papaver somniferum]|uniref:uncharacterized protein LOC113279140 n=1 Tax=Papaver somniferum TaxID=3469 RepID=UPI000E7011CC|nr:uncharacterized protein LOC113279140 [Papaver somniferum]